MVQNQHQTRGGLSFTVVTTERSKSSGIPPLIGSRKRFVNCSDLCSLSLVLSGLGFREGDPQAQFIPHKSPALPFPCLEARPGKNKLTLQTFPKQLLMWDVRNSEFIHGLGCCSGTPHSCCRVPSWVCCLLGIRMGMKGQGILSGRCFGARRLWGHGGEQECGRSSTATLLNP